MPPKCGANNRIKSGRYFFVRERYGMIFGTVANFRSQVITIIAYLAMSKWMDRPIMHDACRRLHTEPAIRPLLIAHRLGLLDSHRHDNIIIS